MSTAHVQHLFTREVLLHVYPYSQIQVPVSGSSFASIVNRVRTTVDDFAGSLLDTGTISLIVRSSEGTTVRECEEERELPFREII